ncbi:PREDICTED: uncharacterized protein LOC105366658 isoform X2 [Ceratosolen solmsi marchali]|uniref:Uncharacterized protein LOC105366658 isoform X2 n=1 Tax=Ceratosolen solmsi marchali TaxID=326594 RepID=A0AAJ6YSL4_9HYME|nr:PREDICTED: uncharacterized protein LOC105366658 isoform X2 [Ceratosolen solmsi marchali]
MKKVKNTVIDKATLNISVEVLDLAKWKVIPDLSEIKSQPGDGSVDASIEDEPEDCSPAVNYDTPRISNVVEHHLEIKSQQLIWNQVADSTPTASTGNMVTIEMEIKKRLKQSINDNQRKELVARFSKLSVERNRFKCSSNLPQVFQVKYLGSHDARGLWGIKHTRKPVDNMVASAKSLPIGTILPFVKLIINDDEVGILPLDKYRITIHSRIYPIESISYGVQDIVYTRIFSMIIVRETDDFRKMSPFECHSFVCESKHHARQITYALATAFQVYSQHVKQSINNPIKS